MSYWLDHWDWECPTLFGVEHRELREVLEHWPSVSAGSERAAACASISALRELLHGASAVAKHRLPALIGVTFEQAEGSLAELHQLAEAS